VLTTYFVRGSRRTTAARWDNRARIADNTPRTRCFGQTFQPHDLLIVLLLVVLEGVLSIDNALVLGLLARRLPVPLQKKALTYGLIGAFVFRFLAIAVATKLLEWRFIKLLGGGYLVYVAVKHLLFVGPPEHEKVVVGCDGLPIAVDDQTGKPLTTEQLEREIFHQTHGVGLAAEQIRSTQNARLLVRRRRHRADRHRLRR